MRIALRRIALQMFAFSLAASIAATAYTPDRPAGGITAFALSPDASRIGVVAEDGSVFWWDVATGERRQLLGDLGSAMRLNSIVFSPDSSLIAVGDESGLIFVFKMPGGEIIARLAEQSGGVRAIVFSGDGTRLAANYDHGLTVWSMATQKKLMSTGSSTDNAVALNRTGAVLAADGHDGIDLWDVEHSQILRTIKLADRQFAQSLLFTQSDNMLVSVLQHARQPQPGDRRVQFDYEIASWEVSSGRKLRTIPAPPEAIAIFPLAVSGSSLFAMSYDQHLRQWNLETGKLEATWETTPSYISADGKFALRKAGLPGRLELWKIGASDETAQAFVYRSPTCGPSITDASSDADGIDTFRVAWMGDGRTDDGYMLGFSGWVARDCTVATLTNAYFKSAARAQQELQSDIGHASQIIRPKGATVATLKNVLPRERIVLVFANPRLHTESAAVVWIDNTTYRKIETPSLPVALRLAEDPKSSDRKK